MPHYFYRSDAVAPDLRRMLEILSEEYDIRADNGDVELTFHPCSVPGTLEVRGTEIIYGDLSCAARGICCALSGMEERSRRDFPSLGVMLDCSRNGVLTLPALRRWLRHLAMLGFNRLMLYTETTYKLPEEPYFGYMNGAYTLEELREIDDYAASLGIETVGCIQVLGHLGNILKWFYPFAKVKDTKTVLKVGAPETNRLIARMLDFWSQALRSRRIHVGMDEAFDLGQGAYLRENGYTPGFELFNRHLGTVCELCRERGLSPMIWSDMYFRLGSVHADYYDPECRIPDEVRNKIPREATLVYWDYYHTDKEFYAEWIRRHRELGFEPVLASGIWTWSKLWHDQRATRSTAKPCIDGGREAKLRELVFTMWGDDGAFCDLDSALAGLLLAADWSFGGDAEEKRMERMFLTLCGAELHACELAGNLDHYREDSGKPILFGAANLLWDDPLLGLAWNNYETMDPTFPPKLEAAYRELVEKLDPYRLDNASASIAHACMLAEAIMRKLTLRNLLVRAYRENDRAGLQDALAQIPETIGAYLRLSETFRTVWLRNYKPFGLEVIQIRQAGQIIRLEECAKTLSEYLAGTIARIEQLEERLQTNQDCGHGGYAYWATASTVF